MQHKINCIKNLINVVYLYLKFYWASFFENSGTNRQINWFPKDMHYTNKCQDKKARMKTEHRNIYEL